MDIKKILESLDQLSEATKETPTGKIHKAEPGGYGRKFDTDEEGDEDKKDKKKKAEPAEKRGRGRPPKEGGESDKKSKEIGQATKALQSFMVGNLPKGKLPGKATTKHTLKDWIEIVKENQNVSVEPLKQQSSVVKKNGEVVAQVDDPNLARQIQQGLSSGKMSISGEQGMDEAASYKPSGRVRTQEIYDKEGNRLGGIIIDYDLDPDHWEAFTITKTGQLGKRQKFKDTGEAIRWVRSNSFMSSQSPVKEEGVMEGSEEKPPRMTHTCEKCGKKWQLQHHCKGAPNKKQGVAEGYSIARKMIAEGRIAGFIPPFSVMGNWVNDSRGRGICEMGESREALKDIADALNAWVNQGVAEGLSKGNYNVGLEDIGKPVLVDGKSGYVLLSIGYSSGNGKLTAHILQPDTGSKGTYDLAIISKGQQGVAEMDKSQPSHGRDGKISHSTYGSRDKKGSDYFKGKEAPGKAITAKKASKDALDILKKQGVAEGLSKQFEIIYLDQSGERKRKIVSGTSKESVARQFKKQYKLEIEQVKQLQQGVAEGSYREGGSITHDGVEYDFDSVMSIAEKLPTKTCSVDKLSWVLKYDTPDEHRVKKADISVPLIVTKSVDGKLAAIDGLHRLTKAVRNGVKTLPVKYIEPSELESAKLKQKGVTEGMDPEKRTRLDDLIDQFSDATDPSDYGNDNDPEDVIAMIRAEFGDKIADQVASGAEKMHFGHHPHQRSDPLAWKTYRGKNRVTKGGKLFKQDSDYLKNTIKSRYKLSGKSATEGVAEADMPTDQGDVGAGLGAGRSQTTLEDTNSSIFKGTQLAEASRK